VGNSNTNDGILYPDPDILNAGAFYLDSGTLYDLEDRYFITSSSATQVGFYPAADGYAAVSCSISGGQLSCINGDQNSFWIIYYNSVESDQRLVFGAQSEDAYYQGGMGATPVLTLNVIPLCSL
jgi:hypothetical protein